MRFHSRPSTALELIVVVSAQQYVCIVVYLCEMSISIFGVSETGSGINTVLHAHRGLLSPLHGGSGPIYRDDRTSWRGR